MQKLKPKRESGDPLCQESAAAFAKHQQLGTEVMTTRMDENSAESNILLVPFHGDNLLAVRRGESVYVAAKPICENIGMDWKSQHRRIKNDPILSEGMVMMTIPGGRDAQETLCLSLDLVNGWLFTIDDRRIKDAHTREKVLAYKRECYRTLYERFFGATEDEPAPEKPTELPPFPEWPLEEMRERRQTAEMYRRNHGVTAAQWIMPQLGFPEPPPELIEHGRQFTLLNFSVGEEPAS